MSKRLILYISIVAIFVLSYYSALRSWAADSTPDNCVSRIEQEFFNKTLSKADFAALIAIVQRYPQNSKAHLLLGNCCDSLGLPLQAMDQYKLAFKYGPNNVDSFLELINALVRSGQLTAASSLLKQAMVRFPAHPQILFWIGNALCKEKRYEEAAALYEEALAKSEKPIVGLHAALGNLHLQKGNYTKAFELASIDLSYDKNLPQANEVMGSVLFRLGRLEKAYPYLAIAFKNNPNNSTLALEFAQSLIWSGKYNEAFMPSLFVFANATSFQNSDSARKTINEIVPFLSKRLVRENVFAIRRFPNLAKNAEIHLLLAKICLDKSLVDLALSECFIATKLNPSSASANYRLALILENYTHQYSLALKYLRQAQAVEPYNIQVKQHLMRLEDRLTISKSDWAWRLKNWLTTRFTCS